jgi:hypothetical protein
MIILAHSALLSLMLGQDTTTGYMTYEEKLSSQFVLGVDKAVDTFFLISGILMAYVTTSLLCFAFLVYMQISTDQLRLAISLSHGL